MMHHKPTQNALILDYIAEFGSITPLEAMRDLGIYRLASRVSDLKKRGYDIESTWQSVPTRYGTQTRIKRYSLREAQYEEAQ